MVVTDAGFRAPWFTEVLAMGWDFVGRLRNKNLVHLNDTWQLSKSLYQGANGKPRYLGKGMLTKRLKVLAHFVLYKEKRRIGINLQRIKCAVMPQRVSAMLKRTKNHGYW